jgi:hypothetical protein
MTSDRVRNSPESRIIPRMSETHLCRKRELALDAKVTLALFVCSVFLSAITVAAQDAPKSIALTNKSDVPAESISKILRKECPSVSIVKDATKSDFTLDANGVTLTLFDRDGKTVRSSSGTSIYFLDDAVKDLCRAIKTSVMVEVVDTQNLTQSQDTRGDTTGGVAGAIANGTTGRRTHTDSSTIYVIINGEHALLDCHERRKGCGTISPGKYYAEQDGDGIWVSHQMPVTHKPVRDHYKIAGSW